LAAASLAAAAARNNAAWVDAVARSHGVSTRRDAGAWKADGRVPPFYPNLVVLDPAADPRELLADPPRGAARGWGLKDSFATLDLAPDGFVPVFDATWIAQGAVPAVADGVERVATPEGLGEWTRGWGETPPGAAIFLPILLDVPEVRFYALREGGAVVAGIAAMVEDEVAGYSNAFGPPAGIGRCLAALSAETGGRPLVGYESGQALTTMTGMGFSPIGGLRVWSCLARLGR
jgi:hypothetical protein